MWTYTSYILEKYCERNADKCYELQFGEFAKFIFDVLWRKNHLIFHNSIDDLFQDLKYLQKLGIIELCEDNDNIERTKLKIKDKKELTKIVGMVEDSSRLTGVKLFDEYNKRINLAIETAPN